MPGGFGSWNDGGTSGGSVRQTGEGMYEMWYSGVKMRKNSRILPREEDVGVAYSSDGVHWAPSTSNPQILHDSLPGPVSALAEVHVLVEHPFRYVYHTLRWLTDNEDKEDIGVMVMISTEDAKAGWRLPIPVIANQGSLNNGTTLRCGCVNSSCTTAASPGRSNGCISIEHIHKLAFTARFNNQIQCNLKINLALHTSIDGISFDSNAHVLVLQSDGLPLPGGTHQQISTNALDTSNLAGRFVSVSASLDTPTSGNCVLADFELIATMTSLPS